MMLLRVFVIISISGLDSYNVESGVSGVKHLKYTILTWIESHIPLHRLRS